MGHVSKRLYSTASKVAVSTSHLKQFPPREAIVRQTGRAVVAVIRSPDVIRRACTHKSFVNLHTKYYPSSPTPPTNADLASLGNALMGLFASEHLHASYPHLPTRVLKAAVSAHVGPLTCASVAHEMGAAALLRWYRQPMTPTSPALLHSDALASIPRALTALVYQERSLSSARKFVHSFFLGRQVDLRAMLKFQDPKRALMETVAKFGRERPKSRLLKETGRFSNSPIFVVGIYSGADKLGEGFGSSLKMAEYRAAEDALHRLYLTRTPSHLLQLPSSTFGTQGDIYNPGPAVDYTPGALGEAEILYASSGRSGIVAPKQPTIDELEARKDDV
ncbi:ribonuclease III domain-containing protein [Melanogaster broomeanus]|nr:ribonuclease III domain-containing protein [Melanogaster broomeanus]